MKKYIVCGKNKILIDKEYKIGDKFITYNLTPIKCTKIEEINNEILYHFITNDEAFNIDEAFNTPKNSAIDNILELFTENRIKNNKENRVKFIKCRLMDINTQNKGYGTEFVLTNAETNEKYVIKVDENIEKIKDNLKEQYEGNSDKERIYLTRGMIDIDIRVDKNDKEWCINGEDLNYYVFNKKDVLNFI
ncbi:TPA: hypothetical protein ACXDAZ_002641 [Clostridium botulinum]